MIYTLTLNPSLDYVMQVDSVIPCSVNRSSGEKFHFGGKGINVSAVLTEFGVENVALGFAGGFTGDELLSKLTENGIDHDFIRLSAGLTRVNVKICGKGTTEINGAGPEITDADMEKLCKKIEGLKKGDTLVLAGSIPPSLPSDTYEKILSRLSPVGVRTVVDASGALLTNTLKYRPYLIKPNKSELSDIAGKDLSAEEEIVSEARKLQSAGAMNVLVSMGGDGAILIDENGKLHKRTVPNGAEVNPVGAGDSAVAGFLAGAENGYETALLYAVASGSATAFSEGLATGEEIFKLMGEER